MPAITLEKFGGELPAWDPTLLAAGQASRCVNGFMFTGALQGWRKPSRLRTLLNAAAKFVYRIPTLREVQALAYFIFITQPVDGDTFTVGDSTYTWRDTLATIGDVKIGPTATDSGTNMIAALTADNGTNENAGVLYGTNTIANSDIKWYAEGQDTAEGLSQPELGLVNIGGLNYTYVQVGAPDFGVAYNETEVAESTANVRTTWLRDLLALADTTGTLSGGANATFEQDITAATTWLEFEDGDTNVVRSSVVDDKWQRYYAASPSQPPKYNTYDRILAGQPFWLLGVPPPGCAPGVTVEGGSNTETLGATQTVDGSLAIAANSIFLVKITPTGAGSVGSVSFTTASAQADLTSASYIPVLYADNSGAPGNLLNVGSQVFGITGNGSENVGSFVNPTGVVSTISYWAGFMFDTATSLQRGGGADMVEFTNVFSNGAPNDAPAANFSDTALVTVTVNADAILEARSYLYTWVTAYGEEGPPSPATLVNGWSNGTWTISLWQPPANDIGVLRNITSLNLYRTVVDQGGSAVFFKVANIPLGTDTYVDTVGNGTVALNIQMPSTNWFAPPENLQGMVSMPNGVIAGFVSNQVWFCDPYHPHAWPPQFVLTTEFPIIGMGVSNGALIVATATVPYVVQGQSPGTFSLFKTSRAFPCLSRGSIVSGDDFVSYMSQIGLITVTPQGVAKNSTDTWFTRDQWVDKTPQVDPRAIFLNNVYFCFGAATSDPVGFTLAISEDSDSFNVLPNPGNHRVGYNEMEAPTGAAIHNVQTDPWTGFGLLVSDGAVWWYDFSDQHPEFQVSTWRSKVYRNVAKNSYSAMKVFFTVPDTTDPLNAFVQEQVPEDTVWSTLPDDRYGYLFTYADYDDTGQNDGKLLLVDARELRKSGELLRIISGFKADQFQFEIVSRVRITNVQIATSATELANV